MRNGGFALVDVLIATLLLAVALTGACATLVQGMQATRESLLATRAVDLATDLAEQLQVVGSVAQAGTVLREWTGRIRAELPVSRLTDDEMVSWDPHPPFTSGSPALLTLRWRGARGLGMRQLQLPIAAPQGVSP